MPMQPIGGQLDFGAPLERLQMPSVMAQPAQPKAGMFGAGKGNIGEAISAALYGALAARGNPVGAYGLQALQQKRQQALEEAKYQQHRSDSFEDWVKQQAYKAANPEPINNDTVNDYNFRVQQLGKAAADDWLRNPPQYMNVPGVGLVQVPRMAPQSAPTAPVGKLTPIPEGGPMPSASGGFPSSGY